MESCPRRDVRNECFEMFTVACQLGHPLSQTCKTNLCRGAKSCNCGDILSTGTMPAFLSTTAKQGFRHHCLALRDQSTDALWATHFMG